MKILDTERLALRELSVEDGAFMLRLLNEPSFLRFIGDRGVRTLEEAQNYLLKGPIDSYKRHGSGMYGVELKDEASLMGVCGPVKRDTLPDVDIGFAFLPEFWSRGYAFESAAAVTVYARDALGLRRLVAIVSPDNDGSMALLGKLGMSFERMITWPEDGAELKLFSSEF